ncbi:C40 family peptidase [Ammoniphilus sp. YIM 78166]|uniref:C40 family peptidase n=1 Tax=Ammoniphilus sp. YIM 78166 TaxID=1644106 RepID=UPI00106F9767|nr:C40 family peptidase [Ammoniphilus sp. YIM 78166]
MRKLITVSLLLFITGCGQGQNYGTTATFETPTDAKAFNAELLQNDPLFQMGDMGIERILYNEQVSSKGSSIQHHQAHDYRLHRVNPNPSVSPLNGSYRENVIAKGLSFLGTPYQYGSDRSNPRVFDCSDFVRWIHLSALGMDLPKDSRSQARYVDQFSSRRIWNIHHARRGDLLFFMPYKGPTRDSYKGVNKANETITHVGVYLGDGRMLHTASQRTGGVRIDNVFNNHYEFRFMRGGSVLP